jgi:hypothetical protein
MLTLWPPKRSSLSVNAGSLTQCRLTLLKRKEKKVTKQQQFDDDHFIVKALNADIERKGLSVSRYAEEIMLRSPGTIYRWRNGVSPVPIPVRKYLLTRDLWPLINDKQRKVST